MISIEAVSIFMKESNRIERIFREPTENEIEATIEFLIRPTVELRVLERLVKVYAPGHVLRRKAGLDVQVGNYLAPPGGLDIEFRINTILKEANSGSLSPWQIHIKYELLHPFSDGNGRSGRTLWAWCMIHDQQDPFAIPFLHRFYYQTLERAV